MYTPFSLLFKLSVWNKIRICGVCSNLTFLNSDKFTFLSLKKIIIMHSFEEKPILNSCSQKFKHYWTCIDLICISILISLRMYCIQTVYITSEINLCFIKYFRSKLFLTHSLVSTLQRPSLWRFSCIFNITISATKINLKWILSKVHITKMKENT